ncbi:MAG TPA: S9 family peptidase [Longimicrobium sp.]|nr:S9 family peptidase [Longimicrobium sp.]
MRRQTLAALAALALAAPLGAQQPDSTQLTLERIFAGSDLDPRSISQLRWREGGAAYTTLEPAGGGGGTDVVRSETATGARTVLVSARALTPAGADRPLAVQNYEFSPDGGKLLVYTNSRKVWRLNTRGDYWVLDRASGRLTQLGRGATPSTLMFAKFSPDSRRVGYVRENNLYVEELEGGRIIPLTRDGSRTTINGTFDWVYEEEFNLRDGWRWSPDSRRIAYWQLDATGVREFSLINNTDSLYSAVVPVQYPKAGGTNSAGRVGVVPADGGATTWLNVPGDPRNNYIARMDWAASSDEVVLQHMNRLQNTNDVLLGDARSGAVRTVLTERDSAWLDVVDRVTWLDGGRSFLWPSERDGWRRLYVVSRDGRQLRAITPPGADAIDVTLVDEPGGWVYFRASPQNAAQRYLWRARLDGRGAERVTPASVTGGWHGYNVAPNAGWAVHTYSGFADPPVFELVRLPTHERVRTFEDNAALRARLAALRRGPMEFFRVDADGVQLDGWMMKPPGFDPARRYPVLFYVYGEPAGQTVVDQFDGSSYLWHLMLTQRGYVVVSVDNRGTPSPRGRAFRKAIYQRIGVLNAADQAAAARAVARWPFVDSTRVGVWGWSGGGASTLNLMFRYPGIYATGMSVAPVSDGHYYDTIYEERYMGLPQQSPEAYRQGSAVAVAAGLKGNLLMVHGTGDDNVHYQNTEAVVNALIVANKPFTMMAYPNRTHCICEGEGTTLHLYGLLTRYLEEHLPAGPR